MPRACDQTGEWVNGVDCANSACSNGACIGVCTPDNTQCGPNETPQKCSASGQWLSQSRCQYVCLDNGTCGSSCTPNSKVCSGTTLRTCRADGMGYDNYTCQPSQKNETAACNKGVCSSSCAPPALKCGTSYCWNLPYGCDTCATGYVWRAAYSNDYVCVTPAERDRRAQENANNATAAKCPDGFVWRGANSSDHLCVTPEIRAEVESENANAKTHTWTYVNGQP
jgi:hypothetical protein